MDRPLVSVIIAARNAERFLQQALDSVMSQSYTHHETIVVDGHSTDGTADIARSFPGVRHLLQKGTGFAVAWNEGLDASRGDLIAFLDSDDLWTSDKLALQVERLGQDPRADCVLGHLRFFLDNVDAVPPSFRLGLLDSAHPGWMPGTLLARRSVFETVGRFGEEWEIASDVDWFARLKDSDTPVAMLPEVLLHKRVHGGNLSYNAARTPIVGREILRAVRHSVTRQHDRGGSSR